MKPNLKYHQQDNQIDDQNEANHYENNKQYIKLKSQQKLPQNIIHNYNVKAITISILMTCFILYRFLFLHPIRKQCVYDYLHQLTFQLNRQINRHCSHVFIGIGQILIDFIIPACLAYWYLFTLMTNIINLQDSILPQLPFPNFNVNILLHQILLFCTYKIIQQIIKYTNVLPYTSYQIWQSPGFPTMLVPYDNTSDYFFSGHTGAVLMFYIQLKKLNFTLKYRIFAFAVIVYMIIMLIVFRVHYVIDIIGGVIYAGFVYGVVERNLECVDRIVNKPYDIVVYLYKKGTKICYGNGAEQNNTTLYDIQEEI